MENGYHSRKHASLGKPTRLSYGSDALQFGDLYLPEAEGPHPTVILIHGGFWRNIYDYTFMTPLGEDLARHGFAAWNIEYRRIGDPGGGWPGTLLDVADAADFLSTIAASYMLDTQRVVSMGHSAGGHLSLWLAGRHKAIGLHRPGKATSPLLKVGGAISLAGVSDLKVCWELNLSNGVVTQLLGGSPAAVPERYAIASPRDLLPLGVPQFLIHGTVDECVPFEMSQRYAEAAKIAGDSVQLIRLEGVDHFTVINPSSNAWIVTLESLYKLLHM